MWSLVPRSTQVLIIVVFAILLLIASQGIASALFAEPIGLVRSVSLISVVISTFLALAAELFWRPLWRLFPVLECLVFPNLNGDWRGDLKSSWVDPSTGKSPSPTPITITVRQGLFYFSVRLRSEESFSYSRNLVLRSFPHARRYCIWYDYENEPRAELASRSKRHMGVAQLEVHLDESADRIFGKYYTDRETTGDIKATRASRA